MAAVFRSTPFPADLARVAQLAADRRIRRGRYFTQATDPQTGLPVGKPVFEPVWLARDIAVLARIVRGPGGGLWFDAGGVFRPNAEDVVKAQVSRALGPRYRANRLGEVLSWLRTLPVEITTDPPPESLVNVANGVLNIDTLELRPVAWDDRFTYRIPVAWNPAATCSAAAAFIDDVLPEDVVASGLIGEIFGMALLPTGRYRRVVMLIGSGSNGKSVFLGMLNALLGVENVASVTLQAISEDRFAKAELFGKLANIAGDIDSRPLERSGAFKTLSGNDPVTADRKYGQPFQFRSYATLIFSANEWPVSHDQSQAYFDRWIALPFARRFREDGEPGPDERRADPKLLDRLTTSAELEGLLRVAVLGARRLRARGGFAVPESVRVAVAEYRSWADTVVAWTDESVTALADGIVTRKAVFVAYQTWCRENGRSPVSSKRFWPRFRDVATERLGEIIWDARDGNDRAVRGIRVERGSAWTS